MTDGMFYKRFPRNFLDATIGWSLEQKGAYALVLDLIFMRDGDLPDDPQYISGQLGCSVRKWNSIKAFLISEAKISDENGIISNKTADDLLINRRSYRDKKAENRARPNKNKAQQSRPKTRRIEDKNTSSSLRSDDDAHDAVQSDFSSDQFYTIPHDWSPSPDHQALAAELGLSTGELNNVREEFIEYWKQRAAVDGSRSAKSERGWECAFGDRLRTASTRWRTGARTGMHADTGRGGGKSAASYAREFASSLRQAQHGDGGAGRVHEGGRDSDVIELRRVSGGGYA